ncbi:HAMP domain-containing sensor histidine kinase [uncultured Maribacter sp.]|uniref:sensor histidine kinase n=1 Tax=uncultured Maribacter sp. TaxID=431308 RepID=UPI002602ED60|nr:HAMP domain-containing sensor histidine kinase [uncultured Maribacter sp.]
MHSLLKRQIRKFLPNDLEGTPEMEEFLLAISKSYYNNDEKLEMIQRSTTISSKELSMVNAELREKIEAQKNVFTSLSKVVKVMDDDSINAVDYEEEHIDPLKIAARIEEQTERIIDLTAERKELLKDLEEQNESLNNYAHMVSHDLKSPIRNMHTLMSWISEEEKENFSEESKFNCSLVIQNLTKVDNLIDGILRHATLEAHEEEKTNVSITHLLEEIKNTIYVPQNIELVVEGELPVLFKDKYKLEQLFKNLIINAVTATEDIKEGKIIVEAIEKKEYWKFSIKDNGKGIPEKYQESIFNMFKKLENNANATGIGLALVKKIINIYEGEVWLESQLGNGTTFYFTIKK